MSEVWLPIPGFSNYSASSDGQIMNVLTGHVLRFDWSGRSRKQYQAVRLHRDGQCHKIRVHRLVYLAHVGPLDESLQVDHINRNHLDNRVENLRAVTNAENQANKGPFVLSYPDDEFDFNETL